MKNTNTRLIVGGSLAAGGMLLAAGLVLGAGIAKADYDDDTQQYLRFVHQSSRGEAEQFSDRWLVTEGRTACIAYNHGWSHSQVWAQIRRDGNLPYSTELDTSISAAATVTWCPVYRIHAGEDPTAPETPGLLGTAGIAT